MPKNLAPTRTLTSKLFIPILLLSLLTFGFSFDRNVVTPSVGVNTYLVIFIGFLFTVAGLLMIKSLACKYPDQSIIRLGNKLLGAIGGIGTAVWLVVIFSLAALLARRVTDEVSAIILFRTPGYVSTLAFLLIAGYMALLGEEALGRLSSVMMFMLPLLLMMLVLSFRQVNPANIHPVNIYRDLGYLKQWDLWLLVFSPVWILGSFNGGESIRGHFKAVILTLACGTIILGAASLAVAGAFGAKGIARFQWPVMSLMNITEFAPSYFFQNFITTFYFIIFISFAAVTVAGFLIILSKGFTEFLGLKNSRSKLMLFIIIAALIVLSIVSTQIHYKETANFLLKTGSLYTFGYVVLLWVGSLFQRRERK
jgi:spore germination protein